MGLQFVGFGVLEISPTLPEFANCVDGAVMNPFIPNVPRYCRRQPADPPLVNILAVRQTLRVSRQFPMYVGPAWCVDMPGPRQRSAMIAQQQLPGALRTRQYFDVSDTVLGVKTYRKESIPVWATGRYRRAVSVHKDEGKVAERNF